MRVNELQLKKAILLSKEVSQIPMIKYIKFYTHYKTPKDIYVEYMVEDFSGGEYSRDMYYDCIDESGNNTDCRSGFTDINERNLFYSKMNEINIESATFIKRNELGL